jgi:hypothetical protein
VLPAVACRRTVLRVTVVGRAVRSRRSRGRVE